MKFIRGMIMGALVAVTASAALIPQMDWKTRRKIRRMSGKVFNGAEKKYDYMMHMVK